MKKLTLTIALVSIVAFAFGQRIVQQAQFAKQAPCNNNVTLKQYHGEKSTNLTVVWEETFDDSIAAGQNGLPANFAYTPNSTEIKDQWQWRGPSPDGVIGRNWYADVAVNEWFTTDVHTVPANKPALFVDFQCSYYWMIEQGSDSLEILYSIDGGVSFIRLWSNRDQALVEASGIDWPYASWTWLTARIQLPVVTVNQDISFKFILNGGTGNGLYIDNIRMGELPDNDVATSVTVATGEYLKYNDTTYVDGLYQLLPINEKRNFTYMSSIARNYGMESANNLVFSTTLTDASGNVVAQKDTNAMSLGSDLPAFLSKDTFSCGGFDNIDAVNIGTYTLQQKITYDNADEDTTNNYWSMDIEYVAADTNALLARNTSITGQLGLHQYDGAVDGNQVGIRFNVLNESIMTGGKIPIGTATTDNTGFTLELYVEKEDGTWERIGFSNDVYVSIADTGKTIDVDLKIPTELHPKQSYKMVVAAHWTEGTSKIYFSTFKGYKDFLSNTETLLYGPASALFVNNTWYYITQIPSMIVKLYEKGTAVEHISNLEKNIKVYPNPTNGVLHIDKVNGASVEIYNMVGNMVDIINNANEFNTVDLSNYAEGTYLVKVYTEEGVVIKKVNLIK